MRISPAILVVAVVSACAPAPASVTAAAAVESVSGERLSVRLDNQVEACVALTTEQVERTRNLVVLGARMRMLQSLAACGCKTALLGYRVRLDDPWRSGVVGRLDTNNRPPLADERVYLLLSTDAPLLQQTNTARIAISCIAEGSPQAHLRSSQRAGLSRAAKAHE